MIKKNKGFEIIRDYTYSTTKMSNFISVSRPEKGSGELKVFKYIPKTKENLSKINKISGKPDVFDDKRYGERLIWW